MRLLITTGIALFLGLSSACGGHTATRVSRPDAMSPIASDSLRTADPIRVAAPDSGIMDTEAMLHPDPALRTWNRLWSLRNWVRRYVAANGRLPATLEELLPPGSGAIDLRRDGWGNAIVFARTGDGYELRTPGSDKQAGTADDMVATAERLPPRPAGAP